MISLSIILISLLTWKNYTSISTLAARVWEVSDTLGRADAIVVLGGDPARATAAVQLYRRALADRILVDLEDYRKLVLEADIPIDAVEVFGEGLSNTYQEACALADWAKKHRAHQFIIPAEPLFSRRVKWIFARKLQPLKATVMIDVLPIAGFGTDDWWVNSWGRDAFLNEIRGYFYYRVRYTFDRC